jgi:hypothetical protein
MTKKCSYCKNLKPLQDFVKHKSQRKGLQNNCKDCVKKYQRSLDSHFRTAYRSCKYRIKNVSTYKNILFTLTWEEWLTFKPKYALLHKQWEFSGYDKRLTSSIDRIENFKGYTFGNIQVITKAQNTSKEKQGENHHFAKLKDYDVMAIRALKSANPKLTQKKLSKMYNISMTVISFILLKRIWAHLPEPTLLNN